MSGRRFGVLPEHVEVSPTPSGGVVITDVDGKNLGAPINIALSILPYRQILVMAYRYVQRDYQTWPQSKLQLYLIERLADQPVSGLDKDHSLYWLYTFVEGNIPPDHGSFYSTRRSFLLNTALDSSGRPLGSIFAGPDDEPPFPSTSNYGMAIHFSTRRRTRFARKTMPRQEDGDGHQFGVCINEAIGNRPKAISLRDLLLHQGSLIVIFDKHRLPDDGYPRMGSGATFQIAHPSLSPSDPTTQSVSAGDSTVQYLSEIRSSAPSQNDDDSSQRLG
ncbi:hypothetical protein ARMGADRAFT_1087932 [Armillaria gallica]|uniref:Uncharacterized protein n=1 Tax=Armillaria gallica TaxID=47427 RepID=A0A2H3D9S5_ARMGA|nr:hypothetical protein ARMGADRAFT_1087932 [Armillaria gallica]